MKRWRLLIVVLLVFACLIVVVAPYLLGRLNGYQEGGTLVLPGLEKPVTVVRDEKGMPYIRGEGLEDVFLALGFVSAQDRLFQMQLTRMLAQGRISELAGERGIPLDVRMRTIGIHRIAKKHAKILAGSGRRLMERYVTGVNAFIETRQDEIPLEFRLAGIDAERWSVEDCLSVAYYMCWDTSGNIQHEIIMQLLADKLGPKKALELAPININPDVGDEEGTGRPSGRKAAMGLGLLKDERLMGFLGDRPLGIGSNNWAVAPRFSSSGKPIVADDPHLDAKILPGVWYPCGLITPGLRIVGVTIPGLPVMVIFRNDHVAVGVTNSYGDCQDLYIEKVDPLDSGRYLEGKKSIPFEVIEETLRVRDKTTSTGYREEKIRIRLTRRGPVISGLIPGQGTRRVITLRWAPVETMGPSLGLDRLIRSRSVRDVREALRDVNLIMLNFVFADADGNIGWHTSGKLPIRSARGGGMPVPVTDSVDDWKGWIPFDEMPHSYNPPRGWVGTCNHYVVGKDYPYYYSSYAAGSYRYRRLKELLGRKGAKSASDHWKYQRDTLNVMARRIAPVMARALSKNTETKDMGTILARWDFRDDADKAAPLVFQAVYNAFATRVFEDELGPDLTRTMLSQRNFWYERLERMVLSGNSPWFDDTRTPNHVETRDELFVRAAQDARKNLGESLGTDPSKWSWGAVHRILFVNPLRRSGFAASFLGSGPYPMGGSCETIYRAIYSFEKPYGVMISASLRMVADLGDGDKVMAVIPGGVTGRTFSPHQKDQTAAYMKGDRVYWWFSDRALADHTRSKQILKPR